MTITEAAELLGLAPSTLRVQLRNGKLRGVKRGRDWAISPAEVERYRLEHGRKAGRCTARHPMHARQVRCEDAAGHDGEHFHSFYMRHWSDDDGAAELPNLIGHTNVRATANRWARQYRKAGRKAEVYDIGDGFYAVRSTY